MKCVHCQRGPVHRRGLCQACYKKDAVRSLYPSAHNPEPTMAELDAIEAEQRKKLPKWWYAEQQRRCRGLKESAS
jgi:hypothetical protein